MKQQIDIVTIFPGFFQGPLKESLLGKAQQKGFLKIRVHDLRNFTRDKHRTVDGRPYGGGPGMVMRPEPIFECVESFGKDAWVILLDAKGKRLRTSTAKRLSQKNKLVLITGHYEGVDHRVYEHLADEAISVGPFITMGGEAPALCLIESVVRWIPGVIQNPESLESESFNDGALEYPQYTRPRNFRGHEVPEVLVSGHHEEVRRWRKRTSKKARS